MVEKIIINPKDGNYIALNEERLYKMLINYL